MYEIVSFCIRFYIAILKNEKEAKTSVEAVGWFGVNLKSIVLVGIN